MFGPRLDGGNGTTLRPPTREDYDLFGRWQLMPEVTRFWGPRYGTQTPAEIEERMKKDGESQTAFLWSIAYQDETVGFTGVFGIDWVSRDAETGIFIGRHDLYGKGIASEAVRLRMAYIWNELGLHRTHNWIALPNRGSWRANQKSGYAQIGTYPRSWYRSGEWVDEWLGEAFPHTFPNEKLPPPWRDESSRGK
ncbi:MAG: GNAT family N-acetyltransferase [Chloroflexi bacterium]|nr:MAG: GNAT family N-acetyltransferase [Chloroflexota bacterium]TMC28617.1 MAG: GNAT family N-acetyltransferase [Chloroflexota bacterium]TMC37116.1 MAG: GNAT family N-acetyltransferase [Chloroflexota bacterium]TME39801.1 MAG: GNAT family N-acetyltransferase [Chloroflexota bacterium]